MEFEIYKVSKNPTDSAQSIINCQDYIGIFLQFLTNSPPNK